VKSSLEKLRTFREDSQHEIHNSRKKQNDSLKERNDLRKKQNNSRKKREDTREERDDSRNDSRDDSQKHIEQKKIRILKKLAVLSKEKYIEFSQQNNVRENDLNFVSQKRNRFSQNFEFVLKNPRRNYNASETIFRIAYTNK
jgi:hypothetical protein